MRLLLRFLGLLVLAAAFAALIIDGTTSVAAGKLEFQPLGEAVARLSPDGFGRVRALVTVRAPLLWDPVLSNLLLLPAWIALGVLGLLLLALSRRPRPRIGHRRR